MARSSIGPNAALRYLDAYDAHVSYWHEVNPAVLLAYVDKKDHAPYIQEYAAEFPDSLVVARIRHPLDGGFHLPPDDKHGPYVASPSDYHNDYGWLGQIENVILNIFNEPDGFADGITIYRLSDWMMDYMEIAVQNKTKSVLFNWGDRQPRLINGRMDMLWGRALRFASNYPDLFYLGLHFYGPDDITESIQGYLATCAILGIKPIRVIGTEFGFDKTNGKESGYKSRGVGGGAYAAWQISQVQHDLAPFIRSGLLVGLNVFQEGNSGGWESFDIENDRAYKDEIKRAALAGELNMRSTATDTTEIPILKRDIIFGQKYRLRKDGDVIKAYVIPYDNDPGVSSKSIPSNAVVTILEKKSTNGQTWLKIAYQPFTLPVYIKSDLVDITATTETAVVIDTSAVDTKPLPALPSVPPSVETPPAPMDMPKPVEPAFKTVLSPIQISRLMAWRTELQSKVDTYSERIALLDSILLSVKV